MHRSATSLPLVWQVGRALDTLSSPASLPAAASIVNHVVNWLSPMKERTTVVIGERGAFVADTMNGDLIFFANGTVPTTWDRVAHFRGVTEGDVIRYALPKREPLAVEQENFRDAVRGRGGPIVTMSEGVHTLNVVEAILTAAHEGRTVTL